jgi:hypothetical protein
LKKERLNPAMIPFAFIRKITDIEAKPCNDLFFTNFPIEQIIAISTQCLLFFDIEWI